MKNADNYGLPSPVNYRSARESFKLAAPSPDKIALRTVKALAWFAREWLKLVLS